MAGEILNVTKTDHFTGFIPQLFLLDEKPYQYIAISSDITEQKKTQKNNALTDLKKRIRN
jgi:hypothetical protein